MTTAGITEVAPHYHQLLYLVGINTKCPPEATISREGFYRRDGTVIFNGRDFIGGTGRYVTTVREFVGGTGRDGGTILTAALPSHPAVTVPPKHRDKPWFFLLVPYFIFTLPLIPPQIRGPKAGSSFPAPPPLLYKGWVCVGWRRRCNIRLSLRELDKHGIVVFVLFIRGHYGWRSSWINFVRGEP